MTTPKKKTTRLNVSVKKDENFGQWYSEVITKSELIDYYEDVSGCYILRPWAYRIWEEIQGFFDPQIKALGVEPAYFPMFVAEKALSKEKDHLDDFAPEVAWVTRAGNTDLEHPIAVRPTSETIIYPAFARWIRSHRDLPLRINQWSNIVRWEFKNPTPFLRTREILWQEGHTAFATKEEADAEVIEILDLYARIYEEVLAVPVIKGRKSDKEKFAGADFTTTVEAYIPGAGRAIQGGTSHSLGQNFSKMFNLVFEEESGKEKKHVWQNSWGLTTRTIGVAVMVHGDDKGLVLPPRAAPLQVVIIPIRPSKIEDALLNELYACISETEKELVAAGVRVKSDLRTDKNPGWKYNYWEQKGVPIRLEIGIKELESDTFCLAKRNTGEKSFHERKDVTKTVSEALEDIQAAMLEAARKERDERISVVWDFKGFVEALGKGNLVLAPWCLTTKSEEWVKEETQRIFAAPSGDEGANPVSSKGETKSLTGAAKTLCIPFNQPPLPEGTPCFTGNGEAAREWCMWGRSY